MRTAFLIVFANLCAFSLGVVVSLWLLTARPDPTAPSLRVAPVASLATTTALSPVPARDTASSRALGTEPSDIASSSPSAQTTQPFATTDAATPSQAPSAIPVANQVAAPTMAQATGARPPTMPAPPDTQIVATAADMPPLAQAAAPSGKTAMVASAGASRRGRYFLQAGAFEDAANATRLAAQLKRFGYDARITPATFGGRTLLLVRVGGFGDREAVAETASAIRKRIGIPVLIVKTAQ